MRNTCIVMPSIRNAENLKNLTDIPIIVVDDSDGNVKKTQENMEIYDYEAQRGFFRDLLGDNWQKYYEIIPHKTDTCRSFGFLVAAQQGFKKIITIDDDCFIDNEKKFVEWHEIVGEHIKCEETKSTTGWFNTLEILKKSPETKIYPRGFPYSRRGEHYEYRDANGHVILNHGLWLNVPDMDAITILQHNGINGIPDIKTNGLKKERVMIAKGTYLPVCSMNTAFSLNLLPAYYQTFQKHEVKGFHIDRYGDIWSGVFAKHIIDAVGDRVTTGMPVVDHRKAPRDVFRDIQYEFMGLLVSQRLYESVENVQIDAKDYFNGYQQLIDGLRKQEIYPDKAIMDYFKILLEYMKRWLKVCEKIM